MNVTVVDAAEVPVRRRWPTSRFEAVVEQLLAMDASKCIRIDPPLRRADGTLLRMTLRKRGYRMSCRTTNEATYVWLLPKE